MRRFQPRIAQLKERYGDDRQKFQIAMMELYKKEKINPVGGCLPILLQMPIFLALYWVLLESVELRQAPWILWIQDLTARDPYFILPLLNIAVMWATQKTDAHGRHGPDAAEDDAVHAAGVRRADGVLPGGPGVVLGDQRRARPAAAVVADPQVQRGAGEGVQHDDAHRHHRRDRHRRRARAASASCGCRGLRRARSRKRCADVRCVRASAQHARFRDAAGDTIDDGIALLFAAPASYHRRGRRRTAGTRQSRRCCRHLVARCCALGARDGAAGRVQRTRLPQRQARPGAGRSGRRPDRRQRRARRARRAARARRCVLASRRRDRRRTAGAARAGRGDDRFRRRTARHARRRRAARATSTPSPPRSTRLLADAAQRTASCATGCMR